MKILNKIIDSIISNKWLAITYKNEKKEITKFWISVIDIFANKTMRVNIFNLSKSSDHIVGNIKISGILEAEILDFISYKPSTDLIQKVIKPYEEFKWLDIKTEVDNILNYYKKCNYYDINPYFSEYYSVAGIDADILFKKKRYQLSDEQVEFILKRVYKNDHRKFNSKYVDLVLNRLSIEKDDKIMPICFNNVHLDLIKKTLILDKDVYFNNNFFIRDTKFSIYNYMDDEAEDFVNNFQKDVEKYCNILQEKLKYSELIDTNPHLILFERDVNDRFNETANNISSLCKENKLTAPLKSFFGFLNKSSNIRKKEPQIVLIDRRVNLNQMRAIYNALKYPVTFVQGPPGTGKSQTIQNIILSCFYNKKSVLICSNNNKPVDSIVKNLHVKYKNIDIPFPFLRVGNNTEIIKACDFILDFYNLNLEPIKDDYIINNLPKNALLTDNSKLVTLLKNYEKKLEINELFEQSQTFLDSLNDSSSKISKNIRKKMKELENDYENFTDIDENELFNLISPVEENDYLKSILYRETLESHKKIQSEEYVDLINICSIKNEEEKALSFNKYLENPTNFAKLVKIFPVIYSTNLSCNKLASGKYMFDLVVMDEAGQCNIASSLIPINIANNLVLIGDPNQLSPVINLDPIKNTKLMEEYHVPKEFNFLKNSIFTLMRENDRVSKFILLDKHYRCGKKIINFSNKRFYESSLKVPPTQIEGELINFDVDNVNIYKKNSYFDEAVAIIKYIKRNNIKDAMIITPFVFQKDLINKLLEKNNIQDVKCGTVHSIQGGECNTIIFSSAISLKTSKKTFEWLKNNVELLNVAITRAKKKFVTFCDLKALDSLSSKDDDLFTLIDYVLSNGQNEVSPTQSINFSYGKSNNSKFENKFYQSISQFCSCHNRYDAKRNVLAKDIFKIDPSMPNLEFDLVIFEKNAFSSKPAIIFEVNGGEHLGIEQREKSDRLKQKICLENNIQLIFIPNTFVKNYEFIKRIILSCKNKNLSISDTLFENASF